MKAIALLSGGLDSMLAARLIAQQNIDVEAVNFVTGFGTRKKKDLKIPLKVFNIAKEFLEIVKNPTYGYGSNINPCIDCKIFIFKKAKEYMENCGASFIVTGEVLGQRPMSQKINSINLIEKESGLAGLIVRPLCAKLLKPSMPEEKGWVDRNKLLSISGRGRKSQIELAVKFGIKDYEQPAGGCLLTDPGFSKRMKDLMQRQAKIETDDIELLKYGRHFRVSETAKVIVGRDQEENNAILKLAKAQDMLFDAPDVRGPISVLRGDLNDANIRQAAMITALYCDNSSFAPCQIKVNFWQVNGSTQTKEQKSIIVAPLDRAQIERMRI